MSRVLGIFVLATVAWGCGAEDERCSELDLPACNDRSDDCQAQFAFFLTSEADAEKRFVACQKARGCGDTETCATNDEGGTLALFPDTCVPDGWHDIANDDCSDIFRAMGRQ